jgi:hypothetical protein
VTTRPEKSAEIIVAEKRRTKPIGNCEVTFLELIGQKPRKRARVEGKGRNPER